MRQFLGVFTMNKKPNRRKMKRLIKKMRSKATHLWLSKPMDVARKAVRVSMYPPFLWEAENTASTSNNNRKVQFMHKKTTAPKKHATLFYAAKSFILTSAIVYDGVIRELTHQQASFKQPHANLKQATLIAQNERAIGSLKQQYLNKKIHTY